MTGEGRKGRHLVVDRDSHGIGSHIMLFKMSGSVHRKNSGSGGSWTESTLDMTHFLDQLVDPIW